MQKTVGDSQLDFICENNLIKQQTREEKYRQSNEYKLVLLLNKCHARREWQT